MTKLGNEMIKFDITDADTCSGAGTPEDPYIVWVGTKCGPPKRELTDALVKSLAIQKGWTIVYVRGAPHTSILHFGKVWERIRSQEHVSIFAGTNAYSPSWPQVEADVFFTRRPDGSYRILRDDERVDVSYQMDPNRVLKAVEEGPFNHQRNTASKIIDRGVSHNLQQVNHNDQENDQEDYQKDYGDLYDDHCGYDPGLPTTEPGAIEGPQFDAWGSPTVQPSAGQSSLGPLTSLTTDLDRLVIEEPSVPLQNLEQAEQPGANRPQPQPLQSATSSSRPAFSYANAANSNRTTTSGSTYDVADPTRTSKWRRFD